MSVTCEICGIGHSKSGKPFTERSLASHVIMVHGGTGPGPDREPFSCELCGATESTNGRKFLTKSNVLQHKRRCHPEIFDQAAVHGAALPRSAPAPAGRTRRKTQEVATAPPKPQVKFCPHCGFNLEVVHAAMEFVNGN